MEGNWTVSTGDSCSFSHDEASGNRRDQRQKRQSSNRAPKAQAQTDGKIPSKSSGRRGEGPSGARGRIPWHPPMRQNYRKESGCTFGETCRFGHVEADGQPSNKSEKSGAGSVALLKESIQSGCVSRDSHASKSILRKESGKLHIWKNTCRFRHVEADGQPSNKSEKSGAKGSVALLKESIQLGCVSRDSHPRKSILRERGKIGIKSHRQILHGHVAPHKNSGKKGSTARRHSKV